MIDALPATEVDRIDELINRFGDDREALIGILQDIQNEWHYLPVPVLKRVGERLDIPFNRIWAVATFYKAFTLEPRGHVHIMVCTGTTCHIRDVQEIVRTLEDELMIEAGHTTPDGEFSLETVHCLGACAMGPVTAVGDVFHGHMTRGKVLDLLTDLKKQKGDEL